MLQRFFAGGDDMSKVKAVLVFSGEDCEMNCALPEIYDIIRGYGGEPLDLIREYAPEAQ
jgi:hypothetical protein